MCQHGSLFPSFSLPPAAEPRQLDNVEQPGARPRMRTATAFQPLLRRAAGGSAAPACFRSREHHNAGGRKPELPIATGARSSSKERKKRGVSLFFLA